MVISLLKYKAKLINKESRNPSVYIVSLIYLVLIVVTSSLITRLNTVSMSTSEMEELASQISGALESGRYEYAASITPEVTPQSGLISTILQILMQFVSVGYSIFIINIVRKTGADIGNLLDGFQIPLRVFLLNLLTGIFIALWSMLLIVPGIIAFYRYRQARYIMLDHPDWSIMQCIKASKVMMHGHKMELFGLDISFLGWAILGSIILPVRIYTLPYFETTYVLYYQHLAGIPDAYPVDNFTI